MRPPGDLTSRRPAVSDLVGGLAGYLFHVTGDPQHAAWARECYDGIAEESADPQTSLDMLTTAGWMLEAVSRGPGAAGRRADRERSA